MDRTKYIKDLSDYIFENISEISYWIKDINSIYRFYASFAMSKAENSKLTVKEAISIQKKEVNDKESDYFNEIKLKVNNLSIYKKWYQEKLKELHDKIEYYNIAKTMEYIQDSDLADVISKKWISDEIILDLHYRLTVWLDELFNEKLDDYDPYFPGIFRTKDNIKVWTKKVLEAKLIRLHLKDIYGLVKNISSLDDIFYIHAKLYYAHIFSNWNKRICRVLEEIYISNLWIETSLSASHGYYLQQNRYIAQIYNKTIRRPLFHTFADFWYSSLLLSGLYLLHNELSSIKRDLLKWYNIEIFKSFNEWENLKTHNLLKIYTKKLKISEQHFYYLLNKEKKELWDLIKETKIWRNVYYSLNLDDKKYVEIKNKIYDIWNKYREFNRSYNQIGFLKHYNF